MGEKVKETAPKKPQQKMARHDEFMKDGYFGRWYPIWIQNAMENYATIKEEFKTSNKCISSIPRPMSRPCIITGRGPSLNKALPLLNKWQHPIFSSASTAFALKKYEHQPEYICAFDSLWSLYNLQLKLDQKTTSWKGSTLLTHPNAEPKMIKAWKWNKYYYRRVFPQHEFFENTFPLMFPWIKIGIRFTGCVANNALTLALFLGYNPIYLVGVDLGWKDDSKRAAETWTQNKGKYELESLGPLTEEDKKTTITTVNGVRSSMSNVSFKAELLNISKSYKNASIVDCSDGMLDELQKDNIENVIKKQGYINYDMSNEKLTSNVADFHKQMKEGIYLVKQE